MENKIFEIGNIKKEYEKQYDTLLSSILEKANTLVGMSDGMYQIEQSIQYNLISIKDYILRSDFCNILKDNNITNYSIGDLKNYMSSYDTSEMNQYRIAIELYEDFENLGELEYKRVDYEIERLNEFLDIDKIKNIDRRQYNDLYKALTSEVDTKYSNQISVESSNILKDTLKDIFNFYIHGNKYVVSS